MADICQQWLWASGWSGQVLPTLTLPLSSKVHLCTLHNVYFKNERYESHMFFSQVWLCRWHSLSSDITDIVSEFRKYLESPPPCYYQTPLNGVSFSLALAVIFLVAAFRTPTSRKRFCLANTNNVSLTVEVAIHQILYVRGLYPKG
jgi:hypothetical protein